MPEYTSDDPECVRLVWRTAIASGGGDCVQVARDEAEILVRDSKDTAGPRHAFGARAWGSFLTQVKSGLLDRPEA